MERVTEMVGDGGYVPSVEEDTAERETTLGMPGTRASVADVERRMTESRDRAVSRRGGDAKESEWE